MTSLIQNKWKQIAADINSNCLFDSENIYSEKGTSLCSIIDALNW